MKHSRDREQKTRQYTEAINRLSHIEVSHPNSPEVPKALFKKALAYERMNRLDEAVEGSRGIRALMKRKPKRRSIWV